MHNANNTQLPLAQNKEALAKAFGHKEVEQALKYIYITDTEADAMAEYIRENSGRKAKQLFDEALANGIDSIDNPPQVLKDYFKPYEQVPDWVDWAQLERGAVAITKILMLGPLALTIPLGATYVSHQATALVLTGHLAKRAESRMVESTIFFSKVFTPGYMKPGANGYKDAIHLRLIHAFARHHIRQSPNYVADQFPPHINQYDTACGQYYYFTTLFIDIGEKFGLSYSYKEQTDIYALWRYTCYLMGVPEELLATSVEDARNKSALLKANFTPNDDSRALLKALVENTSTLDAMFLNKVFPKRLSNYIIQKGLYNQLKYAAFRHVLGDKVADEMAIPKSTQYRLAIKSLSLAITASYRALLKNQVNKVDNVHRISRIGQGLIEEYYRITKGQAGLIDNSAA